MAPRATLIYEIFIIFLLLTPFSMVAQSREDIVDIIGLPFPDIIIEKRLDSFLITAQKSVSQKKLADFYHDVGNKWYYSKWNELNDLKYLKKAISYTDSAVRKKMSIKPLIPCDLNQSLYNLGYFYFLDNQLFESIDSYLKLIKNSEESCNGSKSDDLAHFAQQELINLYSLIGDYKNAIMVCKDLIALNQKEIKSSDKSLTSLTYAYILLANVYLQSEEKEYLKKTKESLTRARKTLVEEGSVFLNYNFLQSNIDQLDGNRLIETKDYKTAIQRFNEVLKAIDNEDSLNLAITSNSLGLSYLKSGNDKVALKYLKMAIEYEKNYSDPFNNLGDLYMGLYDFESSLKHYQQAINLEIGRNADFGHYYSMNIDELALSVNKTALLNHLIFKAHAFLAYYQSGHDKTKLEHAMGTFVLSDKLIDLIRFESTENTSKLYWREKGATLYMVAIEVCRLLKKPVNAYYFMERNKAILLLEDLAHDDVKKAANLSENLIRREFNLKRKIHLHESRLAEISGDKVEEADKIREEIWDRKYEYKLFIDSIASSFPEYSKFKKKVDVLNYRDFRTNHIDENRATLHYILNEENGYGLLTTIDTTALFQLEDIPDLNKDVEKLIAVLSDGVSDINKFKAISNTVFQKLFQKNIYDKIKGKQLTIIPDYTLQQIPFETLVVDGDALNYLFQEVDIAYAYSASLLDYNQKGPKDPDMDFLGVAPIFFDSLKLPELYFSENEIKNIANVYPGETLLNGQASKANFIKNAADHNILHLATHADIGDGDNPWIAFSDSKMFLKEIYATKNHADMVVLSGCNTSNGELKRGEGVMSLARGFFYSGAKSVVSTLWPVSDEAGKDILIHFYKNLDKGLTKSRALQKAKLDYLNTTEEEELKHPYYWAGFVVLGDNSPVSDKPITLLQILVFGTLGIGILVFAYKKIKAHRAAA